MNLVSFYLYLRIHIKKNKTQKQLCKTLRVGSCGNQFGNYHKSLSATTLFFRKMPRAPASITIRSVNPTWRSKGNYRMHYKYHTMTTSCVAPSRTTLVFASRAVSVTKACPLYIHIYSACKIQLISTPKIRESKSSP